MTECGETRRKEGIMIDPTKRIANWNVGYNTERIKAIVDDKRPAGSLPAACFESTISSSG